MTKRIKLFVSDIDGTITNGHMIFDGFGNVSKSYHTRDCTVLWLLQKEAKIDVLMLTGSNYECDRHRFGFLEDGDFHTKVAVAVSGHKERPQPLHLVQGIHEKELFLEKYLHERGIDWEEVAYIGDAMNDFPAIRKAGWSACPLDAEETICSTVDHVCLAEGGNGAVYEFGHMVLAHLKRTAEKG